MTRERSRSGVEALISTVWPQNAHASASGRTRRATRKRVWWCRQTPAPPVRGKAHHHHTGARRAADAVLRRQLPRAPPYLRTHPCARVPSRQHAQPSAEPVGGAQLAPTPPVGGAQERHHRDDSSIVAVRSLTAGLESVLRGVRFWVCIGILYSTRPSPIQPQGFRAGLVLENRG